MQIHDHAGISTPCAVRQGFVPLLTFLAMVLSGCAARDRSIIPAESPNPNIENGIAYDSGKVNLRGVRNIIVPSTTVVRRSNYTNEGLIVMEKRLGVSGSPGTRVRIADSRKAMGCAYKREGDSLVLGTYGEYQISGHGGTSVRLAVYLPEGMTVSRRAELCGAASIAQKDDPTWQRLGCAPLDFAEASSAFPGQEVGR